MALTDTHLLEEFLAAFNRHDADAVMQFFTHSLRK